MKKKKSDWPTPEDVGVFTISCLAAFAFMFCAASGMIVAGKVFGI